MNDQDRADWLEYWREERRARLARQEQRERTLRAGEREDAIAEQLRKRFGECA